jgi:hypothetical protein
VLVMHMDWYAYCIAARDTRDSINAHKKPARQKTSRLVESKIRTT